MNGASARTLLESVYGRELRAIKRAPAGDLEPAASLARRRSSR